ncbi:AIPR family protein [Aeromonas veronii]|uniref:AIPR family protein n=1 Tax=Aeromonas veronii TaxID=654 RepID=UPI003D2496F8
MPIVSLLSSEDNAAPAIATASVQAQRIGKALRVRFQENIHKRECEPSSKDYDIKMASRSIAAFCIYHLGSCDDLSAAKSVCDSSDDGGIDAIFINNNEKIMVVVQSKFNQSGSATWNKRDFLDFKDACNRLQKSEFERFDDILKIKADDINNALDSIDYTIMFVMAHTGKRGAASTILHDMQEWQKELNVSASVQDGTPYSELPFQVHLISAEDIVTWMHKQNNDTIDLSDVEIENYGKTEYPYPAYYGMVSGEQIHEWWNTHSRKLFSKNIRNMLGKTDVNESITDTALNSPENFWYYNNGITVLVRAIEAYRRNNDNNRTIGRFNFHDISVINGAQTVSSIGLLGDSNPDAISKIKVSTRFICIPDDNSPIENAITRANNHQNKVLGRDFASQQKEQIRLKDELVIEKYSYQLLRGESDNKSNSRVIEIDDALDGLACLTLNPTAIATLKSNRGKFFDNLDGSLYRMVFNQSVSGIKLINAVTANRINEKLIKRLLSQTDYQSYKKRYGILTHANRVISAIIMSKIPQIKESKNIITLDESFIEGKLEETLTKIENLIQTDYPTAYPARFFSNVEKISETIIYCNN